MSNMGILSLMDAAQPKRQWSVWTDNRYLVSTVMKRYNDQKDYEARCAKRRRGVRSLKQRANTPKGGSEKGNGLSPRTSHDVKNVQSIRETSASPGRDVRPLESKVKIDE